MEGSLLMSFGYGDGGAEEEPSHHQLQLHGRHEEFYYPTLLRVLPWMMTVLSANLLHYRSLLQARSQARKAAMGSPAPLSFNLMNSPSMHLVRYKIKLLRYSATFVFLLLFWAYIPEITIPFFPDSATLEACVLGLLAGFLTVSLNENRALNMRTLWKPSVDFHSASYGCMWDILRLAGGSLLIPFEEELFYHSWLYRSLCLLMSNDGRHVRRFTDVPFYEWNWVAWIASNGFLALYNGQEWRSYGISGLLSGWVIARRGQFMDGIVAHSLRNLVVSFWVLSTGERQYW